MDRLLQVRLRLTCAATAAAVVLVAVSVALLIDMGNARIMDRAHHAVRVQGVVGEVRGAPNTWWVDTEVVSSTALGPVEVEAPTLTLAAEALQRGETTSEIVQDGMPYLAHARRVDEDIAVVALLDLQPYLDEMRALLGLLLLGAVAASGAAAALAWWACRRLTEPLRSEVLEQRDFLADAAHELRSPLAVIQASASHALTRDREAEEYRRSLVEVRGAATRAAQGVDEILELARLQSGLMTLRRAPLRLDLLAEEVADAAHADECDITARSSPVPLVVDGDLTLLRHAVINLVNNAARRSSRVEVSTSAEGSRAVMCVADNGPGFTPEALRTGFQRFRRGDEQGSHGLGLAIANKIVTAHGGHCALGNGDAGGAVVRLHLPLTAD